MTTEETPRLDEEAEGGEAGSQPRPQVGALVSRVLGFDVGDRRIRLAISDPLGTPRSRCSSFIAQGGGRI